MMRDLVHEECDAGRADGLGDRLVPRVVIVVAEDREDAVSWRENPRERARVAQHAWGRSDEVSRGDDEVRAHLRMSSAPSRNLALADEEPGVDVGDLRDDVPVELLGRPGIRTGSSHTWSPCRPTVIPQPNAALVAPRSTAPPIVSMALRRLTVETVSTIESTAGEAVNERRVAHHVECLIHP